MRLADLADRRVAIWGLGREARAAIAAIRARVPNLPLTLLCGVGEVDAARRFDPALDICAGEPDAALLGGFDVVVKSPGISAYTPALLAAQSRGTRCTSGTALWFGEHGQRGSAGGRVIGVTGTKGKSTTSALIAHLARSLSVRTALAGNIGLPLLELRDDAAALWVIELSSFQTAEAGPLALAVITSLYEEHLDWHGSRERYVADKLKLVDVAQTLLVNGTQPPLCERTAHHPHRILFGMPDGWHVRDGFLCRGGQRVWAVDALSMPGAHNALNACAALAALEAMDLDALAAAPALATFQPLPHRLQPLGERDARTWVNDSISTTPLATLAALESLHGRAVTVIVGGHDRGLDWTPFVEGVRDRTGLAIVAQGANGPRIAAALALASSQSATSVAAVSLVDDLAASITRARAITPTGGVVLLSPGAPSFDQFDDYAARGRRFADLAGFDGAAISGIAGLGIR